MSFKIVLNPKNVIFVKINIIFRFVIQISKIQNQMIQKTLQKTRRKFLLVTFYSLLFTFYLLKSDFGMGFLKGCFCLAQVFSCEFCEIFKNTFFTAHLRKTAAKAKFCLFFFLSFSSFQNSRLN